MKSSQMKKHRKRKNNSRKKGKSISYSETMTLPPMLTPTFIGKGNTLQDIIGEYKVNLHFDLSADKKTVILHVTTKHRNHLDIIMLKLIERFNNIITITNNIMDSFPKDT